MRNGGKAHEEEEVYRPVVEGFRCVTLSCSDDSLQEVSPTAVTSEAEGYKCNPGPRESDSVNRSGPL